MAVKNINETKNNIKFKIRNSFNGHQKIKFNA